MPALEKLQVLAEKESAPTVDALAQLMQAAQNGNKRAYAQLFHTITPLLKSFVARRLSNASDVDDVVQDILLSIHRASHTYESDRSFIVWMYAIARFRLTDHLRRLYAAGKIKSVPLDDMAEKISAEPVTSCHSGTEYLDEAMNKLNVRDRAIISMMKLDGQTAQETADHLGMGLSAVKVAAHRAYKALATHILDLKRREQE